MGRRKSRQKPAGLHEIEVESLTHDGRGVGRLAGKAVFLHGALPGENVRFEYTATHRAYDEGRAVDILRNSPDRVTPQCRHFELCGGCSLQHLSASKQIQFKENLFLENCRRIGKVEPEMMLPPLQAEVWQYRHKARLGVRYVGKKNRVLIGFREKRTAFITDTIRCEVLLPAVGEHIERLAELVMSLSVRNAIPQIEVAAGENKVCLVFRVLQPLNDRDCSLLLSYGQTHSLSIYVQPQGPDSIYSVYDTDPAPLQYRLPLYGSERGDIRIGFRSQDFTQVHPGVNRLTVHQALAELDLQPEERALDLFSGLGNFTLLMARQAAYAVGVEGAAEMVELARINARNNNIGNIEFHTADLFEPVKDAPWLRGGYDKVLLDPPRSGAQEILPVIGAMQPRRIVYVSCNPATLARDAGILVAEWGYRFKRGGVMDMFPHTAHVESMAVFEL